MRKSQKEWIKKNPEKWHASQKRYREAHKEREHRRHKVYYNTHKEQIRKKMIVWWLRKRFGLTPETFEALWEKQKGLCAICDVALNRTQYGHTIDHDHKTGKIRGLLCHPCNRLLGRLHDDTTFIKRIEQYLLNGNNK